MKEKIFAIFSIVAILSVECAEKCDNENVFSVLTMQCKNISKLHALITLRVLS